MRFGLLLSLMSAACGAADVANPNAYETSQSAGAVTTTHGASISVHTTLGIPDGATTSTDNPDHYLSVKDGYVTSYNSSRRTPNWSSWELNPSYLGHFSRDNNYRVDDTLPAEITQAQLEDFSHSGYDRGHLCPSADRSISAEANDETFYLSNMVPQLAANNRGPWERLETYERSLVKSGKELFIIAGGVYAATGGKTIGPNAVAVPTATFKVIVVLDAPGSGLGSVSASTRVIAVEMPNDATINSSDRWNKYIVSARQIEAHTGLDFNADVAVEIQDVIENEIDSARLSETELL